MSDINPGTSFKRQKFWHVQLSAMLDGELLSCDMKVEALSAADACGLCINNVAVDIAFSELEQTTNLRDDPSIALCLEDRAVETAIKIKAGIVFKRIVLVTNPAMMCAGGSGMRVAARDDQGKQEQKAKIEVKESERNKNYG